MMYLITMMYLILALSRTYINGYFLIKNHVCRKLLRHFQCFILLSGLLKNNYEKNYFLRQIFKRLLKFTAL